MLKAINLVEKDISTALNESHTGQDDAIILNETAEIHSNLSSSVNSDDECSDSETGADCSILDDEQIENILNEDIECVDSTYEHTEQILNDIQLHNLGDGSIFTGIRCVAHTLQLAVIDSLKDGGVDKLLNKVRILVRKLRNQTYIYLIKKEKLKLPILDCLTRWHSTYDMIERIQYLKEFIQIMIANDPKLKKISLNNSDWQQVEILAKTLLPAKLCTKKLQSEQLTLSDFYSTWISCKIETRTLENPFSNKLVKCMEYREQFIMNNKVLLAAIFLDPRFKVTLSEIQYDIAISHLISIWVYLKDNKINSKDNHESMEDQIAESDNFEFNQNSDPLEQFLQERESVEVVSCSSQNSTSTVIENLLKTYYLNQKRLSYKINILQFWKSMEDTYPELYILAKIVFAVPSTQVSVERLFSGLKFILSPYRSNITSKNLENQLIVRTNRLFEKKIITKE
ncbi:uncharacterized protein LOC132936957 [Metopolophium dirhodum]|uniref:uncharacterized protein LOC132936957 n=1 Tax=Metopolophium dirhodum TaxID=44670 RepID=UPI002990592A|nr:uncharacterized protein LOC132936957 [Metopolophium dirhodum]